MKFQYKLKKFFQNIFKTNKLQAKAERVNSNELVSKYLFGRRKNSLYADGTVKANAFSPPPNLRMSVCRINELNDQDIWNIGDKYVASVRKKPVIGRVDILTKIVEDNNLIVESTPYPYPQHADIINWPTAKEEQLIIKAALALKATSKLSPSYSE